jgi:hypothetical protein
MGKRSTPDQVISAGPLFARLSSPGAAAKFADKLDISEQRLSNWKRRGIPATVLPEVATALDMTVDAYLREAGRTTGAGRHQDDEGFPDRESPTDLVLLTTIIKEIEQFLVERREKLPPDAKAKLVTLMYDRCSTLRSGPDQKMVVRYLKLVA